MPTPDQLRTALDQLSRPLECMEDEDTLIVFSALVNDSDSVVGRTDDEIRVLNDYFTALPEAEKV